MAHELLWSVVMGIARCKWTGVTDMSVSASTYDYLKNREEKMTTSRRQLILEDSFVAKTDKPASGDIILFRRPPVGIQTERKTGGSNNFGYLLIGGGIMASLLGAPYAGIALVSLGLTACGETEIKPIEPRNINDDYVTVDVDADTDDDISTDTADDDALSPDDDTIIDDDDTVTADDDSAATDDDTDTPAQDDDSVDDPPPPIVDIDLCIDAYCGEYGECTELSDDIALCLCDDGALRPLETGCPAPVIDEPDDPVTPPPPTGPCEDAVEECRVTDGFNPLCGFENERTICTVTDSIDIYEDRTHHDFGATAAFHYDACSGDDGFLLISRYQWIQYNMNVIPPPLGSYYLLDASMTIEEVPDAPCEEDDLTQIRITLNDEQNTILNSSIITAVTECIYQNIATFTTVGVTSDTVTIRHDVDVDPNPYNLQCRVSFERARIWSCMCE